MANTSCAHCQRPILGLNATQFAGKSLCLAFETTRKSVDPKSRLSAPNFYPQLLMALEKATSEVLQIAH
jgi:hypothetical protein